jgi:hypothetical protein
MTQPATNRLGIAQTRMETSAAVIAPILRKLLDWVTAVERHQAPDQEAQAHNRDSDGH